MSGSTSQPPQPGWWLASDGRWYPPEQHPEHLAQQPPPPGAAAPPPGQPAAHQYRTSPGYPGAPAPSPAYGGPTPPPSYGTGGAPARTRGGIPGLFLGLTVLGAALLILSATVLPWLEFDAGTSGQPSDDLKAIDEETNTWIIGDIGDGWALVVVGGVVIIGALAAIKTRPGARDRMRWLLLGLTVAGVAWLIADRFSLQDQIDKIDEALSAANASIDFGLGFWLAAVGLLLMIVGLALLHQDSLFRRDDSAYALAYGGAAPPPPPPAY